MAKKLKISIFNIILFLATFAAMILVSIFNAKFSSIFYILISGAIGLFIYSIGYFKEKLKQKTVNVELQENASADIDSTNADNDILTNDDCSEDLISNADQIQNNNDNITLENSANIEENYQEAITSDNEDFGGEK